MEIENPGMPAVKRAANIILSGGIVAYPTETCYGLAADATNPDAVRKLYRAKRRPRSKPIPIIVSGVAMMEKYGRVTRTARMLAKEFMPGPLTIVIDKKGLPDALSRGGVAFRISSNATAAMLVRRVGRPITATSANISGQPPIYDGKKVAEVFAEKVDMILDAGTLKEVRPSTCLDARSMRIVREGAVPSARIVNFIQQANKR